MIDRDVWVVGKLQEESNSLSIHQDGDDVVKKGWGAWKGSEEEELVQVPKGPATHYGGLLHPSVAMAAVTDKQRYHGNEMVTDPLVSASPQPSPFNQALMLRWSSQVLLIFNVSRRGIEDQPVLTVKVS